MNSEQPPQHDSEKPEQDPAGAGNAHDADCERILALIPAYSIGATNPDEAEFVKARLAECPQAITELALYMKVSEALHYSAEPVQPPTALADALQASINSSPHRAEAPLSDNRRLEHTSSSWKALPRLVLGAVLLALLILNIFLLSHIEQVNSRQEQLETHLHDQDKALMLLGLGSANRIELPAFQTAAQPKPFAAIVWDPQGEYALLYVKNFPTLQPEMAYQLWLERGGAQTSAGTFSVDEDGLGTLVFRTSLPLPTFDSIEITVEPAHGSEKPTTAPIARRNS